MSSYENPDLGMSMRKLQVQEQQTNMLKQMHQQLTLQIYGNLVGLHSSEEELGEATDKALEASTFAFKRFGMIKEEK